MLIKLLTCCADRASLSLRITLLVAFCSLGLCSWAQAQDGAPNNAVTVGDPSNPKQLGQEIQDAYKAGARYIVIKPGTYFLSNPGTTQIPLDHWQDAVLSAYHVILILNNDAKVDRLFQLDGCNNVTIEGPVLSQTQQTAYQGQVAAIGADPDGTVTCDWHPSIGYPQPSPDMTTMWIDFVNNSNRSINTIAGDYYNAKMELLPNGLWRFHLDKRTPVFAVGDWIVSRYGNPPGKIGLSGSFNCTIKDVTMMRNGFAPIFDGEGGGNHYIRVHWAQGPTPNGATDLPLVTNAADGIHSPDDTIGPDIEGCTMDGVFLDDCIAIHGIYFTVHSVNGPQITVDNGYSFYTVGDPVRIANGSGFNLIAKIANVIDNHNSTSTLTLDSTTPIPANCKLSELTREGAGYKILDCRFGNTRSRGIIAKTCDGLIQGNVISHCGLAIRLGSEYWAGESDYSQNVVIQGNVFVNNNWVIQTDGPGSMQNKRITIQNNRFQQNLGHVFDIGWTDGLAISNNVITPPASFPGNKPQPVFIIWNSKNIAISNNTLKNQTLFAQPILQQGNNVSSVTQDINAP